MRRNSEYGHLNFEPQKETTLLDRKPISNVEGKIKKLFFTTYFDTESPGIKGDDDYLLTLNKENNDFSGEEYSGLKLLFLKYLAASLPKDVELVVVLQSKNHLIQEVLSEFKKSLAEIGIDKGVKVTFQENDFQNGDKEWSRDLFVIGGGGETLITPDYKLFDFGLSNRRSIDDYATMFAESNNLELIKSPFYFEGGDLRMVDNTLFVGADTLLHNVKNESSQDAKTMWDTILRLREEMENWFGVEIVMVGEKFLKDKIFGSKIRGFEYLRQPIFHLDLFFTPIGNNNCVLADPKETLKILEDFSYGDIQKEIEEIIRRKKEELNGFSDIESFVSNSHSVLKRLAAFKEIDSSRKKLDAIVRKWWGEVDDYLGVVAEQLAGSGMVLHKVPIITDPFKYGASLSYNNVLLESYSKNNKIHQNVYLPRYGNSKKGGFFDALDAKARTVYEKADFNVCTVASGFERMFYGGSLNCSLQEIRE